ncbi:hypothetical protein [Pseudooceanicola sp. LIPI14-2-Ac024]|uniref:hypothetical protein n=1 Tax=Pseudooceanicola sp. LIPI14-2-Ac024 TaxID=3344875 RepID=UPI0035D05CA1
MSRPALTADCSACAALCCLALALDKGEAFAIDKPAGLPCPNLDGRSCSIHSDLDARGFAGCVRYDCAGAGQRVTQEVFAGRSWQDEAGLTAPMIAAFADMRAVQQRLELLAAAEALPLASSDAAERARLEATLWPDALTAGVLEGFGSGALAQEIDSFIAGLRRYVVTR